MANFPNTPVLNQTFVDTTSGFSFKWDGTVWQSYAPSTFTPSILRVSTRSGTVSLNFAITVYGRSANTVLLGDGSGTTATAQTNDLDLALFD